MAGGKCGAKHMHERWRYAQVSFLRMPLFDPESDPEELALAIKDMYVAKRRADGNENRVQRNRLWSTGAPYRIVGEKSGIQHLRMRALQLPTRLPVTTRGGDPNSKKLARMGNRASCVSSRSSPRCCRRSPSLCKRRGMISDLFPAVEMRRISTSAKSTPEPRPRPGHGSTSPADSTS